MFPSMVKAWLLRLVPAVAVATLSGVVWASNAAHVDGGDIRTQQLGELGLEGAPPRVLATFKVPEHTGKHAVACGRAAKPETSAHCVVIDPKGAVIDSSVGLNVMRVAKKGKVPEHLELLWRAEFGKTHVYIATRAPFSLESIDVVAKAFQADLSAIEFMPADQAFPLGVPLGGGVRADGGSLVFGDAGRVDATALVAEISKVPAAYVPPEPPAPEAESDADEEATESPDGDGDGEESAPDAKP